MMKNMKWLPVAILTGWLLPLSPNASPLADHPSPYLRLHVNDPVAWRPWGEEVLREAADGNRLIFLSIGYFACHWCHVMQRESFQDPQAASILNKHFIPVKVDRELRPRLDRRMLDFVDALTGQAGWPLNVFLTPDGYPVSGFTYLPKDEFVHAVQKLATRWRQNGPQINAAARLYFEQIDQPPARSDLQQLPDARHAELVDAFIGQAMEKADEMQGGFGAVTKFPSYPQLAALLDVIRLNPNIDDEVVDFVRLTLDRMADGHLMDHVNGGFFRYVTDPDWQTPHFEKMLYDNAQLARLYFEADSLWPDAGYAATALRTIEFMLAFLRDERGAFRSSLSALDENDVEGGSYYWSRERLKAVLTPRELEALEAVTPLSDAQSILLPALNGSRGIAADLGESIRRKLAAAPTSRPPVDDKRLASWNALALEALLMAEEQVDNPEFNQHADRLYRFIREDFIGGGGLRRMAGDDRAETTLEDYAFVARALQRYAARRGSEQAAGLALELVERTFSDYFIDGLWRQTISSLVPGDHGEAVLQDGVLPSPLTALLEALQGLPGASPAQSQLARELSGRVTPDMLDTPYHYASFILHRQRVLAKARSAE